MLYHKSNRVNKRVARPVPLGLRHSLALTALLLGSLLPSQVKAEKLTLGGALEKALNNSPNIKAQRVLVDSARGTVTQAAGTFDWNTSLVGDYGNARTASISSTTLNETTTSVRSSGLIAGIGRKFRPGIDVEFLNTLTSDRNKSSSVGYVGSNTLALVVTVPLLKDAGYNSTTSTERSAQKALAATRFSSGSEIASAVYDVAVLYWNTLAASQSEEALKGTFTRARSTTNILEERVQGGLMAPVEYRRSLAELRLREIDLEDGSEDLFESQSTLIASLGEVSDPSQLETITQFPTPASREEIEKLDLIILLDMALENRLDMKALRTSLEAEKINVAKAKNDLLPDLDLQLSHSMSTAGKEYANRNHLDIYSLSDKTNPSSSVMISLSYPLGNNAAKGALTSSRADLRGIELDIDTLRASIHSDVVVALDQLRRSQRNFARAKESETVLKEVQQITMNKLSRGEATMTDLISVEDRLTESRLKTIDGNADYTLSLAALKLAIGTLTTEQNETLTIRPEVFFTLPTMESRS